MAVQDYALNGSMYRSRVNRAMRDWEANGGKLDVEKIQAYIKQISEKDLTYLKADLSEKFYAGQMKDPNTGGEFYLSTFHPGNFVNSTKGWTNFTFESSSVDSYTKDTSATTSASLSAKFGIFSIDANGSHSKKTDLNDLQEKGFHLEFSIAQVSISRPWFSPDIIMNKAWRWKDGNGMDDLSDGLTPPTGQLIAYSTSAVFIKDIKITSSDIKILSDKLTKSLSSGGSLSIGPLQIGAQHDSSTGENKLNSKINRNTLTVEGMQLIAFKNFVIPKSPNPSPKIKKWV
jgi:hypothetical protein